MSRFLIVHNIGVYAVRKLKIERINTRREQNRRFYSDIILQVRVKSAILRFKAKDEALSSALNSDGHKHFVVDSFFISINIFKIGEFRSPDRNYT